MDFLTILLIGLGAVAVIAFIVVAYFEVARKPTKTGARTEATLEPPAEATVAKPVVVEPVRQPTPVRATAPATAVPPQPNARAAAATTAASIRSTAPAPASEVSGRIEALGDGARTALFRLSVMEHDFSRDTARAVAACVNDDLQALAQSGLLEVDPSSERMALPDAVRENATALVTPEEAHAARLRHAEHFIHLGLEAQKPVEQKGGLVALALELFVEDAGHFRAAYAFLSDARGFEQRLVKLLESVGYTTVLELPAAEAMRWLKAGLSAAESLGEQAAQRDLLSALASRHTDAGDHILAREAYERVAAVSHELGDLHEEGRALGNLGLATHRSGDHASAVGYYERVLAIMRELGDRRREGLALSSLGQAVADGGEPRRAIEFFEQHLALAADLNDLGAQAYALAGIARAHAALGENEEAIRFFEQQLTLAQRARDLPMEGSALSSLGEIHHKIGQHERMLEYYTRLLDVAHLLGQAEAGVRALGHIGKAHQAGGRTSKALESFDEQLRIARKIGDREGEALALADAARIVHFRGQVVDAITRASAALPILEELKSSEAPKLRAEIEQWRTEQH